MAASDPKSCQIATKMNRGADTLECWISRRSLENFDASAKAEAKAFQYFRQSTATFMTSVWSWRAGRADYVFRSEESSDGTYAANLSSDPLTITAIN